MKIKSIIIPLALAVLANAFFITTSHADNLTGAGSTFSANFVDRCRVESFIGLMGTKLILR